MKRSNAITSTIAVAMALASPAFAQRQQAVGPGIIPLSPTGSLGGVDMSGSGITGTLSVGVPGGPAADWWMKGFGSVASQGASQSFAAYDTTILGTMIGYDMPVGLGTREGVASASPTAT